SSHWRSLGLHSIEAGAREIRSGGFAAGRSRRLAAARSGSGRLAGGGDGGAPGEPVRAPDAGLVVAPLVLVRLHQQRSGRARLAVGVDRVEDQVGAGDVRGFGPGLVPALRLHANADL